MVLGIYHYGTGYTFKRGPRTWSSGPTSGQQKNEEQPQNGIGMSDALINV